MQKKNQSLLKNFTIVAVFIFFTFTFLLMKQAANDRNKDTPYLLSAVYQLDEKVDQYAEEYYEQINVDEPLNNEEFIQEVQMQMAGKDTPQKVTLTNVSNFYEDFPSNYSRLDAVTAIGSAECLQLFMSRTYSMDKEQAVSDMPFEIISDGKLGLVSNTLEYHLEVKEDREPEEWVAYLPDFVVQIQAINELSAAASMVYIHTSAREFLYDSTDWDQLIEIKNQELG